MTRHTTRSDPSEYDAKYPFNKVHETPSGHQWQVDDTPGKERIFFRHASGSSVEFGPDGKIQVIAVGDQKVTNKGGVTLTIDENNDVKISGHSRLNVGGGAHIEVAGDAAVAVGGDTALAAMGALNARCKTLYLGSDGDANLNVGGNLSIKAAGTVTTESGGNNVTKAPQVHHN